MDLSITVNAGASNLTDGLGISPQRAYELLDQMKNAFESMEISPSKIKLDKLIEGTAALCKTPGELFWLAARIGQFSQINGIRL